MSFVYYQSPRSGLRETPPNSLSSGAFVKHSTALATRMQRKPPEHESMTARADGTPDRELGKGVAVSVGPDPTARATSAPSAAEWARNNPRRINMV